MMLIEMPKANENLTEATLNRWLIKEGDVVIKDQPLCELITDKAQGEMPSPTTGTVLKIFGLEHAVLPVGYILCAIGQPGTRVPIDIAAKNEAILAAHRGLMISANSVARASSRHVMEALNAIAASNARATPAARRLAKELSVNLADVAKEYNLTAPISEKDIRKFASDKQKTKI